jgi:meso-butanediol dehydrogenase/(S,S)-butanediol dehydrogenase/diacetyl reductase
LEPRIQDAHYHTRYGSHFENHFWCENRRRGTSYRRGTTTTFVLPYPQMERLAGKIALVTGGASGIGEAIALAFAREGARAAIADVQEVRGQAVASSLRQEGLKAIFLPVDLSNATLTAAVIPAIVREFGGIDIIVNAAAVFSRENKKSVAETPLLVWEHTMKVNVTAAMLLAQAAIPHMIQRGGGSIINVASIGGIDAFSEFSSYSVSKAALIQLTKSLALDFGSYGIRANALCPGAIDTPGNDPFVTDREEYLRSIEALTPLGRIGSPEEVARAALFLASDESSYVSGTTLIIDGGRMARA